MPLQAVTAIPLSEQVFAQLTGEIMRGQYRPGATLPAERALSEAFGVNRHVVREALKRLEQVGMIRIAQGGGTRVLDYRQHAGLDLLVLLADHTDEGGRQAAELWLSVLEMRATIGIDASRLCARRASEQTGQALLELAAQMRAADSDVRVYDLEVRFWDVVLEGSENLAYRLAFNSMMKGATSMGELARTWSAQESRAAGYRLPLARAIARGDHAAAERIARRTMRAAVEAVEAGLRVARGPRQKNAARG